MSIVGDEACPKCREKGGDKTGNHLIIFADGNKSCNRCGYIEINGAPCTRERDDEMDNAKLTFAEALTLPVFGVPAKMLRDEVCNHYGIRTEFNEKGEPERTLYPHYTDGVLDGYKIKSTKADGSKSFGAVGSISGGELFGQSVSNGGGKFVVITEGEDDAAAVWQCLVDGSELQGWSPSVVSLTHGAGGAVKDISTNLEFLDQFDRVVLCFDEDKAGRDAVDSAVSLFNGNVFVTKLSEKDANEMLLQGKGDELKWAVIKTAKKYQPDGIIDGADTWDRYKNQSNEECIPYPEDWKETNRMTYGFRPGSIVTITAGTSVGKSQLMRELKYHTWASTDWKIADVSLEEDVGDSVAGLMSLHMGQRLHLPDVQVAEEHERKVHADLFESGRFSFYDHFGGMDDSSLFNKLRYFGGTGHRAIFLDHLSIIVSEYAAQGGERERIDTVMTKLAKLAKELNVVIFIIVHLRKESSGTSFENGAVPTLDDLRGSGSLKQLSWDVIALSRNSQHYDKVCRNITKITVLKCRFTGRTGTADYLGFDEITGRMKSVKPPSNYEEEDRFK